MNIDYKELLIVTYRSLLSLSALFLVTKLLGKKQVSQLSLFDYVIGILIGNFAAEMTINLESGTLNGIIAVFIFGAVAYLISFLTMKSLSLRRFFMSTPTVLIEKGEIIIEGLKKVKFDINDLLEVCRIKGYFDIATIEYAIMEANGDISILPKEKHRPVTLDDLNIAKNQTSLAANVIIDGEIMKDNILKMNRSVEWLKNKIKGNDLANILLATLDEQGKLEIYLNNKNRQGKEILE